MSVEQGFEPHLAVDDTTVTGRDVEMLRAIDECGSMHRAAEVLGRSYPHLQRRVVELEGAVGTLTRRARGGSGGGGTELTAEAHNLIRQFERLRITLAGVTTVAESVVPGTVVERDGDLATVETAAGELTVHLPAEAETVEITVRADTVVLMNPDASGPHTSLRNQLAGTVAGIERDSGVASVSVDVGGGVAIESIVTVESVERLGLSEGDTVVAAFKTTAARATPSEV